MRRRERARGLGRALIVFRYLILSQILSAAEQMHVPNATPRCRTGSPWHVSSAACVAREVRQIVEVSPSLETAAVHTRWEHLAHLFKK